MQVLTDTTDVRAACASEDEGNEPVTMQLGLLRAIIQERDGVASRLQALANGVEQHAAWMADLNRLAKGFCARSKE